MMAQKADPIFQKAVAAYTAGRLDEARLHTKRALQLAPRHGDALNLLGIIELLSKRHTAAIAIFDRLIAERPAHADAYVNRGNALFESGRLEDAIASYDAALARRPADAPALTNRGNALLRAGRPDAALASYDQALALDPGNAVTHGQRGVCLSQSGDPHAALCAFAAALDIDPHRHDVHKNRGIVLLTLGDADAAVASLTQAINQQPDDADAYFNRGNAWFDLQRFAAALADYDQALARALPSAGLHVNRGNALFELGSIDAAIASYEAALACDPDHVDALANRGTAEGRQKRYEAAIASFDAALRVDPTSRPLWGIRRHVKMQICAWEDFAIDQKRIEAGIAAGVATSTPFALLTLCDSPRLQQRNARAWVKRTGLDGRTLPFAAPYAAREKIRVGYFSADFWDHPVALLTADLLEGHTRTEFEVTAFSFGPDTADPMRQRIAEGVDRFVDVRTHGDREIASLSRVLGIDIAIDLGGFTENARPRIFALGAAPLQVGYIGYLGTLGASYMQYLIADEILVPEASRAHYHEKLIYLPSYQANPRERRSADRVSSRAELGLPPDGFVFCCFNANYKLCPPTFDRWMRILRAVPHSVLFLLAADPAAKRNLEREALGRGVDPARLIFGAKLPQADYLARYRAVDLFLDTLPYNAGTTASDALWMGVPVLTCLGESFAGRMAASLLRAVGLSELIVPTYDDYERLAVQLAQDPERLAALKQRLTAARTTARLFDTPRFIATFESALRRIHARHRAGLSPEHIMVDAD